MAGQLTIDTLRAGSGVLATQNGMTGIAKAWCTTTNNGSSPPTINASFNISSVTRNGTGCYTYNFTTAMPNIYYTQAGMASGLYNGTTFSISNTTNSDATQAQSTTSSTITTRRASPSNGAESDPIWLCVMFIGN
jgi:hypothetical protein